MLRFRPVLLFLVMSLCVPFCRAEESVPADQIFPDATKGFFSIRNLKEFGDQWKQTQLGRLLNDPLMADFKKEVQQQLTQRMEKTFGLTFDGISSLPSGEIAFGMIAIPNKTPGYVLTMDVAGKRQQADDYLNNLTQKLVAAGVKRTTEEYKGQTVTVLIFPPPEAPALIGSTKERQIVIEPIERRAYYLFRQGTLIASDRLHLIQMVADRVAEQTGKSLADVEDYQVVMKRCIGDMPAGSQPILRWYVEPLNYGESVRLLLQESVSPKRKDKPSIFSILKEQGFDAIRGIGGVVSLKTEEKESIYRTFIYAKKPYRLAMQMLKFPDQTNFAPPIWMPSDLARCTMIYIDPMAIFDNFGMLFDAIVMQGEEGVWKDILAGLEEDPHGPQINLREELIVHLGDRAMGMSRYEKPITTKSESIVVAVELREGHEPNVHAAIEKLFGTDPEMKATGYRSYKIWHRVPADEVIAPVEFEVPSLVDTVPVAARTPAPVPAAPDTPPVFPDGGVVIAKGCLFVSTNIDYLKTVLDRLDAEADSAKSAISNEAEYKEIDRMFAAMGITNTPHFFQFFARTHETLRPTYEMIRKGQMPQSQAVFGKVLNMVFSPDEEAGNRKQTMDGRSLPEFDKVQHYFGTVGIYGVSEDNGYFIKGFSLERKDR